MNLWRLTRRRYADLQGRGGEIADGRWHTRGGLWSIARRRRHSLHLEVRVHLDLPFDLLPNDYVLMRVNAPDDIPVQTVEAALLPESWRHTDSQTCRGLGDAWLAERASVLLLVPSAIIPFEQNVLINPLHPESARLTVADVTAFAWDSRLW